MNDKRLISRLWRIFLALLAVLLILLLALWYYQRNIINANNTRAVQHFSATTTKVSGSSLPSDTNIPATGKRISYSLTLGDMGYKAGITLAGLEAGTRIFIPINRGLKPDKLILEIVASPNLPKGYIRITNQGRFVASYPLSPGEQSLQVPLDKIVVRDGIADLQISIVLEAADLCQGILLYKVDILPSSRVLFTGEMFYPRQLSDFFPKYLKKVVFYYKQPIQTEELDSILWLASFLARRYQVNDIDFKLVPFENFSLQTLNDPFTRVVVWDSGKPTSLVYKEQSGETGLPYLRLGSRAEAAKLFLSNIGIKTAIFPAEETSSLDLQLPEYLGPKIFFQELGYEAREVRGMGAMQIGFDFALADFGPDVYPKGVLLRIAHSWLEDSNEQKVTARAQLELYLNGVNFENVQLKGSFEDIWVEIPTWLLQRNNRLELRFVYSPPGGECLVGALPFTATVEPTSFFSLGQGNILEGFDTFPQRFLPKFQVFLQNSSPAEVSAAAKLVYDLQKTTRTTLWPYAGNLEGTEPLLAIGDLELARELKAPVHSPDFSITDTSGKTWLRVVTGSPYSALQAYSLGKRQVLLLTYSQGSPSLALALLDDALANNGWFDLHGDIALRGETGAPEVFRLQGTSLRLRSGEPTTFQTFVAQYRFWIFAFVLVILVAVLLWVYPRVVTPALGSKEKS